MSTVKSKKMQVNDLTARYLELNPDDFDTREELRQRELDEAKARAAQMEKTIRWWSDCTANWREKWGKVRAERNKAREECRQLKLKLEAAVKELSSLKRENQDLRDKKDLAERDSEKLLKELKRNKRTGTPPAVRVEPRRSSDDDLSDYDEKKLNNVRVRDEKSIYTKTVPKPGAEKKFIEQILEKNEAYHNNEEANFEYEKRRSNDSEDRRKLQEEEKESVQKIITLTVKLEETQKLLAEERSSKGTVVEKVDILQNEISTLKLRCEELSHGKEEALDELAQVREERLQSLDVVDGLYDEAYRSGMERKVKDLRAEIERLQTENTLEWSKREKLETEKLTLEREAKKYKAQVEDLESELSRKAVSATLSNDLKQAQADLQTKNKELSELKVTYSKLKKQMQEKTEELEHSKNRIELSDAEVKKLRNRVEELKKELAEAEDQVDVQLNNVRKQQRCYDEVVEEKENLKVELEHLQSRLRQQQTNNSLAGMRSPRNHSRSVGPVSDDEVSDLELEP